VLADPRRDLGARGEAEFGQDVVHVALDGPRGDDQCLGDAAVRQALRDEFGDLLLAVAQDVVRLETASVTVDYCGLLSVGSC